MCGTVRAVTWLQALVLGLIQGITEFLPISSSAHLILAPYLLGWHDQGLTFDIVVNAGTLLAVMVYFRRDLLKMVLDPGATMEPEVEDGDGDPDGDGAGDASGARRPPLLLLLMVGSLPVVVAGMLFYDWISTHGRSTWVVATTSIAFGLLLYWTDRTGSRRRGLDSLGWRDALLVGLAEALALLPGTSRSGVTMTMALWLGFRREDAARFSFLLAIPVGLAALVHDLEDLLSGAAGQIPVLPLLVGFAVAGLSAYLAIGWLIDWVKRQDMLIFVVYRVILGCVLLGLIWVQ